MAERNINALSIVPSSMNKGVKMPGSTQLGDEINYGLMDGKAMIRTQDGTLKKTNQLAANVAPFAKLAKLMRAIINKRRTDFGLFSMIF